jgi:MFS transporter, DHA1 family, multidrug resistance protein
MDLKKNPNLLFISLSQFGMTFCFNFVMVFIPFYLHRISPYPTRETLIWIGLIMGSTSCVAAVASTFWGGLTSRYSPKMLYMRGLISHAVLILLLGFTTSLPLILGIRIVQGILGGISTIGLIIVTSSSGSQESARDIGFFQNSLTLGQLLGPPAGAFAASMMGYRGAFVSASAFVFVTIVFCYLFVVDVPREDRKKKAREGGRTLKRKTLVSWGLCFSAAVQLMFLPSILPNVFETFHMAHAVALKWAGLVVMAYTGTAVIGTYLLCGLSSRVPRERLILFIGGLGVALQCALTLAPGIFSFVTVRMIQTGLIAATLPLTISFYASELDGKVIGFLNSARFAGNAMGPFIGTSILAFAGMDWVFLSVGCLGVLTLAGFLWGFKPAKGTGS